MNKDKLVQLIKRILKSDLIYTAVGEPIKNGMIAIDSENRIVALGPMLVQDGVEIEYFEGALCPAFVNTHCHLELSHLKGKVSEKKGLDGFVKELQQVRSASEDEIQTEIFKADLKMHEAGIIAVGDISNGSSTFECKSKSKMHYHSFIELFAFDPDKANATFEHGLNLKKEANELGLYSSIIPHSPYSVSKKLFELIAEKEENIPLSIHNQESAAENEMYEKGEGKMMDMLSNFGLDLSAFQASGNSSLLSYLDYLPKNSPLLLVHNTFTSKEDIIAAENKHSNLYWCFCVKANLYIEDRIPAIMDFVELGVKCTLGTDSLASNNSLSIWEEMQCIQEKIPALPFQLLVEWATINGAEFLGIDSDFGSIEVGKKAAINQIVNGQCSPVISQ